MGFKIRYACPGRPHILDLGSQHCSRGKKADGRMGAGGTVMTLNPQEKKAAGAPSGSLSPVRTSPRN